MADAKTFAETVLRSRHDGAERDEVKDGYGKERPGVQAYCLRIGYKEGRRAEGVPWTLFSGHCWDDTGRLEQLTLLFTSRVVTVQGLHLGRFVDLLSDGQLRHLDEHDSREVELLREENAERPRGQKRPVVMSIQVAPPFADVVREILGEESFEHRLRASSENRGR